MLFGISIVKQIDNQPKAGNDRPILKLFPRKRVCGGGDMERERGGGGGREPSWGRESNEGNLPPVVLKTISDCKRYVLLLKEVTQGQ